MYGGERQEEWQGPTEPKRISLRENGFATDVPCSSNTRENVQEEPTGAWAG